MFGDTTHTNPLGFPIIVSAATPLNPSNGTGWYDVNTGVFKVWDGTSWLEAGGGTQQSPVKIQGSEDVTQAIQFTPEAGLLVFASTRGTVHASWAPQGGNPVAPGDLFIFNDAGAWDHIPTERDMEDYVPWTGGTMDPGAALIFQPPGGGGDWIGIEMSGGIIHNVVIDEGTF